MNKNKGVKLTKRKLGKDDTPNIKAIDAKKLLDNLLPVSEFLKSKGEESRNILELFPDIARALQRVATSVVSPNDVIRDTILYNLDGSIESTPELGKALNVLSKYMDEKYELTDDIEKIVYDALCIDGAAIFAFIPVTKELDKKISDGFESDDKLKKFIDITTDSSYLSVEDKMIIDKSIKGFESNMDSDTNLIDLSNVLSIDDTRPIYKRIPVNACIPIISKSAPDKHLAYALLLGEDGEILGPVSDLDSGPNDKMMEYLSGIIKDKKIELKQSGKEPNGNVIKNHIKLFLGDMIAKDIEEKLGYSGFKKEVVDRIRDIAFTRLLKEQRTRIIILNPIQVSYLAFEYRSNGTGKSLLDGLTLILSIRATVLFRKLYAYLESIKTNIKAEITLSPQDDDPENTIETIIKNIRNALGVKMPLWSTRVEDFVKSAQESGLSIAINGDNIYETKVDITRENVEVNMPDDEISNEFKKLSLLHINRPYDLLDTENNPEFAAEVLNEHKLFTKKAMADQRIVNKFLTDHVRKAIINDPVLQEKLNEILNKDDLNKLVKYLKVSLPEFDYDILDGLSDKFSTFTSALDDLLTAIFDDGIAQEGFTGEIANKADMIKGIIRYNKVKEWCIEHNYFPEIFIALESEEGLADYTTVNSVMEAISKNIKMTSKENKKLRKLINSVFEKLDDLESADNETEMPLKDKNSSSEGNDKGKDKKDDIDDSSTVKDDEVIDKTKNKDDDVDNAINDIDI